MSFQTSTQVSGYFARRQALLGFAFIFGAILCQYSGLDLLLANSLYHLSGNQFMTHNWWLDNVLHKHGRHLVIAVLSTLLILFLASVRVKQRKIRCNASLAYLLVASIMSIVAVAVLKHFTTLPCPWDTQQFGGSREYIGWLSMFSSEQPVGHCFPSGHASGGYALLSFYFFIRSQRPKWFAVSSVWALLPALVTGLSFGIAQQLRGAHFLSHDLTTFALCWLISGYLSRVFFAEQKPHRVVGKAIASQSL